MPVPNASGCCTSLLQVKRQVEEARQDWIRKNKERRNEVRAHACGACARARDCIILGLPQGLTCSVRLRAVLQ